jgi:hypothetical protein
MSDFEKVQELIEDAGLSRILRDSKRRNANSPSHSLAHVRRRLKVAHRRGGQGNAPGKPGD